MKTFLKAIAAAAILASGAASATQLTTRLHVDNGYAVYVSTSDSAVGTFFGWGNYWPAGYVNSTTLAAGQDYYLHIYAYDQGGIAGLLGQFSLGGTGHQFANGLQSLTSNTTYWQGNNVGFNGNYQNLVNLGTNGVGPWGSMGDISSTATWIWAGDAHNNDIAFFTTKISAVPEPGSMALLGLGLAGLGVLRRRKA